MSFVNMPLPAQGLSPTEPVQHTRPVRLDYLDGLRGIAALYVVLAHTYMTVFQFRHGDLPRWLTLLMSWMGTGRFAVDIFIVLSGYCLMLPVARSDQGRLPGGLRSFFLRRARRILPPYYAALGLSLLVSAVMPSLYPTVGMDWAHGPAVLNSGLVWSHLFLVHNLNAHWVGGIDYPMWSVATEWQIYFFFALLLLPLWRRFGLAAVLLVSLGLGVALDRLFPAAYFHFLALFACGMAGAAIGFSPKSDLARWQRRVPWGLVAGSLAVPLCLFLLWKHNLRNGFALPIDLVIGVIIMACLIYCTQHLSGQGKRPPLLRLFESRWAVGLGVFSYSLYLVHALVLAAVFQALKPLPLPATPTCLLYFGLGIPLSLLTAYAFFLVFERPFLRRRKGETPAELARDAALSPAP